MVDVKNNNSVRLTGSFERKANALSALHGGVEAPASQRWGSISLADMTTATVEIGIRRAAIPVLSGVGRSCGELTRKECELNVNMMTSADVQKLRDGLDRRAGGLLAVVCSPFLGLMQIHTDAEKRPAAVALVNTRISAQGPVRVKLRGLPELVRSVTWRALCAEAAELPVERLPGGAFVSVPEIGAWNAGYLDVSEAFLAER